MHPACILYVLVMVQVMVQDLRVELERLVGGGCV